MKFMTTPPPPQLFFKIKKWRLINNPAGQFTYFLYDFISMRSGDVSSLTESARDFNSPFVNKVIPSYRNYMADKQCV